MSGFRSDSHIFSQLDCKHLNVAIATLPWFISVKSYTFSVNFDITNIQLLINHVIIRKLCSSIKIIEYS